MKRGIVREDCGPDLSLRGAVCRMEGNVRGTGSRWRQPDTYSKILPINCGEYY